MVVSVKDESDKYFDYQSVNTQLLGLILERATNKKLYTYMQEKIWQPLGMESDMLWSIDSKKNDEVKAFCCMNARAKDFAKFGRLYLNNGNWNGKQIIPKNWVEKTIKINDDRNHYIYQNQFWHFPKEALTSQIDTNSLDVKHIHFHKDSTQWVSFPSGIYYAEGHLGQYIINVPDKNLIIIRFGKKYGKDDEWVSLAYFLSFEL